MDCTYPTLAKILFLVFAVCVAGVFLITKRASKFGEPFYPRLHRFNGKDYVAVEDYDRKVAELKSLRATAK